MAQTKKGKTASKKKSGSSRTAGTPVSRQQKAAAGQLRQDITILLVLTFCILLFISNLGLGGNAGAALSSVFFGLFGVAAYAFPFLVFFLYIFILANRRRGTRMIRKIIGLAGLYVFAAALFHLLLKGYDRRTRLGPMYMSSAEDHTGGGMVGGLLVRICGKAFGPVGAGILIVLALIVFTIILTQKPLVSFIREAGERTVDSARDLRQRRLEERDARDELEAARLEERDRRRKERQEALQRNRERSRIVRNPVEMQTLEKPVSLRRKRKVEKLPEPEDVSIGTLFSLDPGEHITISKGTDRPAAEPKREKPAAAAAAGTVRSAADSTDPHTGMREILPESSAPAVQAEVVGMTGKPAARKRRTQEDAEAASKAAEAVGKEILSSGQTAPQKPAYVFPPLSLLRRGDPNQTVDTDEHLRETAAKLQQTLHTFGVDVTIQHISCGPTVTRYELTLEPGVKVSRIVNLQDDIKMSLAATDIRIEAPIPGKSAVGIEVPNKSNVSVAFRDLLESSAFMKNRSKLAFAVGKDIAGQVVVADIAKMPHLLIAGATGSGKSVCINTLIMSILYRAKPDEVKLIMIDPKVVELSVYNGIPHLYIPVVTDSRKAAGALNWAVSEMEERYRKFAELGARDLASYNQKLDALPPYEDGSRPQKLPRIVIIVDELADLMMVAQHEVEDAIVRLTQLARAAGLHLVIATQRPSVNVITGLIKANMPSRIALAVTSAVDSKTILDKGGAEKLLGKGDMLFAPQNYPKPVRVQGAYIDDEEIVDVVNFLKESNIEEYDQEMEEKISSVISDENSSGGSLSSEQDAYFADAGRLIIEKDKASIGMLQRAFKIGFNRAARIMDQLCEAGVVGEEEGKQPRKILMSMEQFDALLSG